VDHFGQGHLSRDVAILSHDAPWLAAIYVKDGFRRQGIATQLIARCENEAIRSNAKAWYLYTEFASSLYEKLGWRHMERCEYKGATVDVMSKRLRPA
jgi:GNAT superfamily N-acetyltransferase|tara:strand:- start:1087 stop:1377 length:291 start_codon:yes stop_codon:yes gene_type:complete